MTKHIYIYGIKADALNQRDIYIYLVSTAEQLSIECQQ